MTAMKSYAIIIGVIRMRENGCSWDECSKKCGIGKGTVQKILTKYASLSTTLEELEKADPNSVTNIFFPPETKRWKGIPMPEYATVFKNLMRKGGRATLFGEWEKYRGKHPDGYSYTQFVEHFHEYAAEKNLTMSVKMAVERIPGERMYIDWVGDHPKLIFDPKTGEFREVHIFVTTLGVGSKIYAEAFFDEKMGNFVAGTVHAIAFYGAIPKFLVPDNASTAVRKHTKDGILLTSTYSDLESFYDVIVLPPPPRKPKGKPTVEKAVKDLEGWAMDPERVGSFTTLDQLNEALSKKVAAINADTPDGWECSRDEMFERYDKPCMRPIKDRAFTTCDYVLCSRVPDNYHVEYDGHYYSVFYTYCGKPVTIKATMSEVRICDENNKLICRHPRLYPRLPKYSTIDDHMPPHHRYAKELNSRDGDYYRRWAGTVGPEMRALIEAILASAKHEEQTYRACNGVLHSCDGQSRELCNEAAKRCVELKCCKYTYFKRILADFLSGDGGRGEELPEHANIRGKDFYS